jgi:hypothetical protein
MSQPTCAQRVHAAWESRREDLEAIMNCDDTDNGPEDIGPFHEYGLCFDYVAPHTFKDQDEGYWRYQFSHGGPSEEIRFFGESHEGNSEPDFDYAEFWFLDWFDGASVRIPCNDKVLQWAWQQFAETGTAQSVWEEAMKDYTPPEPVMKDRVEEVKIEIDTENSAYRGGDIGNEIARQLRELADKFVGLDDEGVAELDSLWIYDVNGNKTMYVDITTQEVDEDDI